MTSIEWLEEQLNPDMKTMQGNIIQDLLIQAKEMHKQEIIKAFEYGVNEGALTDINYLKCSEEAEFYYQETFVSKGSDEVPKCTCNIDSFLCQIHGTSDGKNIIAF